MNESQIHTPPDDMPREADYDDLAQWWRDFDAWEIREARKPIPTRKTPFPHEDFVPIRFDDILKSHSPLTHAQPSDNPTPGATT